MNQAPPPPLEASPEKPERTERFELAILSKILISVTAVFILAYIYLNARFMGADPSQIPFYIGMAVGSLLFGLGIPLLLGWIVWRVTGRRKGGGNLVLCVLLVLVILGQVAYLIPCEPIQDMTPAPGAYESGQE